MSGPLFPAKPLGRKAYGSIGHLPCSRMGPADHHVTEGQARICTEKARDKRDRIIVQEKLDGSCVAVAMVYGTLIPLGRAGYPAKAIDEAKAKCGPDFKHVVGTEKDPVYLARPQIQHDDIAYVSTVDELTRGKAS